MKSAVIFLHGNLSDTSDLQKYISTNPLIICADGGSEHALELNITPDVVIGDFDSISVHDREILEKRHTNFISYPKEKDYTDAELAVRYAINHGAKKIIIAGLLGDRIDHMMANLFYLSNISSRVEICIIEKDQEIRFVEKSIEISGRKGDEVSLIPIQTDSVGVSTEGLYYSLIEATLPFGSTRGVSNVMVSSKAKIRLKQGILMVVHRHLKH